MANENFSDQIVPYLMGEALPPEVSAGLAAQMETDAELREDARLLQRTMDAIREQPAALAAALQATVPEARVDERWAAMQDGQRAQDRAAASSFRLDEVRKWSANQLQEMSAWLNDSAAAFAQLVQVSRPAYLAAAGDETLEAIVRDDADSEVERVELTIERPPQIDARGRFQLLLRAPREYSLWHAEVALNLMEHGELLMSRVEIDRNGNLAVLENVQSLGLNASLEIPLEMVSVTLSQWV